MTTGTRRGRGRRDRRLGAAKGREVTMSIRLIPGVCFVCDCTDEYGCDEGCSWVDAEQTLCSACERRGLLFMGTGPGHYPRPTDERRDRIVALAKDGRSPTDIAAQLGVGPRIVNMTLWRARKAGRLPKGGKSR
jgi:hypothetical protein